MNTTEIENAAEWLRKVTGRSAYLQVEVWAYRGDVSTFPEVRYQAYVDKSGMPEPSEHYPFHTRGDTPMDAARKQARAYIREYQGVLALVELQKQGRI